jgi:hypothetical protein
MPGYVAYQEGWVAKLKGRVAKFMKRPALSTQWVRLIDGL